MGDRGQPVQPERESYAFFDALRLAVRAGSVQDVDALRGEVLPLPAGIAPADGEIASGRRIMAAWVEQAAAWLRQPPESST